MQEVQQEEICLNKLRVLGLNPPPVGGAGLQLFKPCAAVVDGPASASQHCAAPGPAITLPVVRSVDAFLAAYIEGLPPQVGARKGYAVAGILKTRFAYQCSAVSSCSHAVNDFSLWGHLNMSVWSMAQSLLISTQVFLLLCYARVSL